MKSKKLTPATEAINLHRYGKGGETLTPNAIYQAAVSDMAAKRHNTAVAAEKRVLKEKGRPTKCVEASRSYAFLGDHVKKARSPAHLIQIAIANRSKGELRARNANTLRVYSSDSVLRCAAKIAEEAKE